MNNSNIISSPSLQFYPSATARMPWKTLVILKVPIIIKPIFVVTSYDLQYMTTREKSCLSLKKKDSFRKLYPVPLCSFLFCDFFFCHRFNYTGKK